MVAFERDAEHAMLHLLGEVGGGDGEIEQEDGRVPGGFVVQAEADATAAVAEEGAGDGGGRGRASTVGGAGVDEVVRGVGGWKDAAGDHVLDEAAEGATEAHVPRAVDGDRRIDDVETTLAPQVHHRPHLQIATARKRALVRCGERCLRWPPL